MRRWLSYPANGSTLVGAVAGGAVVLMVLLQLAVNLGLV